MTGHPLTLFEARRDLDDYRLTLWAKHTYDKDGLARILCGHPVPEHNIPTREPVDQETALKALDGFHDTHHRPPTPPELVRWLDDLTAPGLPAADALNSARNQLAAARAATAERDRQLRTESENRRTRRPA